MAARKFKPIGNRDDMTLSLSGMSMEEIFGENVDEGFYRGPARGFSRSGEPYIPIEEIPDRAHNPEQLAIRKGL